MPEDNKGLFRKTLLFLGTESVILGLIFILALSLRLLHVFHVWETPFFGYDALEYHEYAAGLLDAHTFGDDWTMTYRGPGYPFFLSCIYFLWGKSYHIARIVQALLGSVNSILIFFLAKKVFSRLTGYIAAIISATLALYIFYSGFLLPETLYATLIIVFALVLLRTLENPEKKNLVWSGIILGVASMVKSETLIIFLFIMPVFLISGGFFFSKALKEIGTVLIVALIVVFPWTLRNYLLTKEVVIVSSQCGENLWIGNNPDSTGWNTSIPEEASEEYSTQAEMDKSLRSEAIDFIRNNPREWLELARIKFFGFFDGWSEKDQWMFPERFGFIWDLSPPVSYINFVGLLSILGILLTLPYFRRLILFYAFFISSIFLQIIFYVDPAFRVYTLPFIIIFAASFVFILERFILKKFFANLRITDTSPPLSPLEVKIKLKRVFFSKVMIILLIVLIILSSLIVRIIEYRQYSQLAKNITIIEGELPEESNYFPSPGYITRNMRLLGGKALELRTPEESPSGYYASYSFNIKKDGVYNIFLAGTPPGPLNEGSEWFSPYSISIDGVTAREFTEEIITKEWPAYLKHEYLSGGYYFVRLMTIGLKEGPHKITVTVTRPRKHDNNFTLFIDAIIISPEDFKPESSLRKIPKDIFF